MTYFTSVIGELWPGYDGLKRVFIFGDSYSAVGYDPGWPAPTEDEPLGIEFPGYTWTEGGEYGIGDSTNANWIGHLIISRRKEGKSLLVYDYAVGGHTLRGVKNQVEHWFMPNAGKKPDWAPWTANESLFVTWVGINDCAYYREHEDDMKRFFELQEQLYESGARNFLFIDVPPIHLSPAFPYTLETPPDRSNSYFNWNEELRKGAQAFYEKHPETTMLVYSSWDIFNKVHDDPEAFGFSHSDLGKAGGAIWMDQLHPTSRMHKVLADDIDKFFKIYQKYGKTPKS